MRWLQGKAESEKNHFFNDNFFWKVSPHAVHLNTINFVGESLRWETLS